MKSFSAPIEIIGINPYVQLPDAVLKYIFHLAWKDTGAIPVKLVIEGRPFLQTLVRYKNVWRLYINTPMLKVAQKGVDDTISVMIDYDAEERITVLHPKLEQALAENAAALSVFNTLNPSLQKEIKRYINNLKTAASVEKNVIKAVLFLTGKERFIGRDGLDGHKPVTQHS